MPLGDRPWHPLGSFTVLGMATRAQVQDLLQAGHSYASAGRALGISPGAAYLTATGRPADGGALGGHASGAASEPDSPQRLVGPAPVNPLSRPRITAWVRERASRELQRPS
jgi:hypothetical protein